MKPVHAVKLNELLPGINPLDVATEPVLLSLEGHLSSGAILSRADAELMLELNALARGRQTTRDWDTLFVAAIATHFLDDLESPRALDDSEARLLMARIMADGDIDPNELAAIVQIAARARSTPHFFKQYVLSALGAHVCRVGRVGATSVDMLNQVLYGNGGFEGARISLEEAEFLVELNRATAGRSNHPSWQKFFVGALTWFLIHDPTSPGRIADAEAGWLLEKLGAMAIPDENTIALIDSIRARARSLPDYLAQVLNEKHPVAA
jgi:hypothetical protein